MDLSGVDDTSANPLTPDSGPVPPAQVQSTIPNWFSPTAWAQSIGGIPGSIESWWSGSVLNPAHDATKIGDAISDTAQTAMSNATNVASSVTSSITTGLLNTTTLIKWVVIGMIAFIVLYFISTIRGIVPKGAD